MTPKMPPIDAIKKVCQNGNSIQALTRISAGRMKTSADKVPAEDAKVWTMLFSSTEAFLKNLKMPIEITAAGMEVAKVRPTFKPK